MNRGEIIENRFVNDLLELIQNNELYTSKDEIYFDNVLENLKKLKEESYTTFQISKKLGGVRTIHAPNDVLKTQLIDINWYLTKIFNLINPPYVFGYIADTPNEKYGIKSNANIHLAREWILNFDLSAFFESINSEKIKSLFLSFPFNYQIKDATFLSELVTYNNYLATGSPASPIISNFIFFEVDLELQDFALSNNAKYSRYADDITFSFDNKPSDQIVSTIFSIVNKYGFKVNYKKYNLRNRSSRQEVNGLIVNQYLNIKREYYKSLRAALHNLTINYFDESKRYIKLNLYRYKKFIYNRYKLYYKNRYKKDVRFDYNLFDDDDNKRAFIYFSLKGKISFIHDIIGKDSKKGKALLKSFRKIFDGDFYENEEPSISKNICYITNATAKSVVFYAYLFLKHNKIDEPEILKLISDCSKDNILDHKLLEYKFLKQSAQFIQLYDYLNYGNRFENFIQSNIDSGYINTIVKYWDGKEKFMKKYYRIVFHTQLECEYIRSAYNEGGIYHPNTGIFAVDEKPIKEHIYAINREFLEKLKMRICKGCASV